MSRPGSRSRCSTCRRWWAARSKSRNEARYGQVKQPGGRNTRAGASTGPPCTAAPSALRCCTGPAVGDAQSPPSTPPARPPRSASSSWVCPAARASSRRRQPRLSASSRWSARSPRARLAGHPCVCPRAHSPPRVPRPAPNVFSATLTLRDFANSLACPLGFARVVSLVRTSSSRRSEGCSSQSWIVCGWPRSDMRINATTLTLSSRRRAALAEVSPEGCQ